MNNYGRTVVRFFLFFLSAIVFSQVLTTGSLNGIVKGGDGQALEGANVLAKHIPSGTSSGGTTRSDGSFNIPNLKVGGPYIITASFIGYSDGENPGVYVSIGENKTIDFTLSTKAIELSDVLVVVTKDINKMGSGTQHNEQVISNMPTVVPNINPRREIKNCKRNEMGSNSTLVKK